MKAVAIPIEVLVIVVIAVIVLLGLIAVYFSGWTPFASTTGVEGIKAVACRKLVFGHNCGINPDQIEITELENIDDLQDLCDSYYGSGGDSDACKAICGCGGIVTIIGGGGNGGNGGNGIECETCGYGPWVCDDCNDECPFGGGLNHNTRHCICTPPGCTGGACTGGVPNGGFICDCSSRTACP